MSFDREDILERLVRLPDRLDRLVDQNPHDLLCQAGAGGAWGAVEIMAFLRDWDEVVDERMDLILTEQEPEFEEEDPDLWSIERDYHAEDPENVARQFRERREKLVERLRALQDEQWQRSGRMPDGTIVTLEDIIADLAASDQEQVNALREVLL
jgi:hypothetical protein